MRRIQSSSTHAAGEPAKSKKAAKDAKGKRGRKGAGDAPAASDAATTSAASGAADAASAKRAASAPSPVEPPKEALVNDAAKVQGPMTQYESELAKYKAQHRVPSKNWDVPSSFPDQRVLDAYAQPIVDESKAAFEFRAPDVPVLRQYCTKQFGWTAVRLFATQTYAVLGLSCSCAWRHECCS